MASATKIERTRRKFADESNRYDVKRERLVRCARKLAEHGNAAKISVTSITTDIGITRGLFYYYFNGKEELNKAIVDTYVYDLMAGTLSSYNEDMSQEEVIRGLVSCVHAWLYDKSGELKPMWHVLQEMELVDYARQRASEELAEFLVGTGILARNDKAGDVTLFYQARFVAVAILGECRLRPDATIDTIGDAACAALRCRKNRAPNGDGAPTF